MQQLQRELAGMQAGQLVEVVETSSVPLLQALLLKSTLLSCIQVASTGLVWDHCLPTQQG